MMACEMIGSFDPTNKIMTSGTYNSDQKILTEANYWWKFASATFGWQLEYGYQFKKGCCGLLKGFLKNTKKINKNIICETCDINQKDIVVASWRGQLFIPGYFVAIDHKTKSIVIAIRGSFELKDAIIDLTADQIDLLDDDLNLMSHNNNNIDFMFQNSTEELYSVNKVHKGMLDATTNIKNLIEIHFQQARSTYPDYKIILTGHSLGAAVAALLTILWLREHDEINIHAYCYGCPPIMSLNLTRKYQKYITTFVNGNDCIPRLSYGSVDDIKTKILEILSQSRNFLGRIFQTLQMGNPFGLSDRSIKKLETIFKSPAMPKITPIENPNYLQRLWVPGTIIHIHQNDDEKLLIELSNPELLSNVVLTGRMFLDHFPDQYELALGQALEVSKRYNYD